MQETDLVEHRIPTTAGATPKAVRQKLYTVEEVKFQKENLPLMVDAGIMARSIRHEQRNHGLSANQPGS
jgi:hypothetical protein